MLHFYTLITNWDFPCGASDKESPCQCRRCKRHGFNPWVGKILWRRAWQPTPVFLPGNPTDGGAWGLQSLGAQRAGHDGVTARPRKTNHHKQDMKTTVLGRVEMMEQQDVTLPFSHKHIKNTRRAALEGYLLNAGRRLQSVDRASKAPQNRVEQKIRKVRKDSGWALCPRRELCKSKDSCPGKPPSTSEENAAASLQQPGCTEGYRGGQCRCPAPGTRGPWHRAGVGAGTWALRSDLGRTAVGCMGTAGMGLESGAPTAKGVPGHIVWGCIRGEAGPPPLQPFSLCAYSQEAN